MQISIEIVDLVAVTLIPVKISHIGLDISNRVREPVKNVLADFVR